MFGGERYQSKLKQKSKQWGKKKFDPTTKVQEATPWTTFKYELEQTKSNDEESDPSQKQLEFNKQREQNYRKNLITEGVQRSKNWDNFQNTTNDNANFNANAKPKHKSATEKKEVKQQSGKIVKNKNPFKGGTKAPAPLLTESDLKDFDSRNLTVDQNTQLKNLLTKAATVRVSLGHQLMHLKYKKKLKK